jgi:carbamoyl-phosphate synthase small subunit
LSDEAILVLEDGTYFEGTSYGAKMESVGELVFNTSITGYQEILTDPSYFGQMVVMTNPHIGNYGVNDEDVESKKIYLSAMVAKEFSKIYSNKMAIKSLQDYFIENDIPAIDNIDTRKLVKHLRNSGSMNAIVSSTNFDIKTLVNKAKSSRHIQGIDLVREITTTEKYYWNKSTSGKKDNLNIVLIDFGVKYSILNCLSREGCNILVVPANIDYEEIIKINPDGIFLSNGPGDPEPVMYGIELVRKLFGKYPILGICLGCQIIAIALGGRTYKLKFGHHGGNHPVKDLRTSKIYITAQNHCFAIDDTSLDSNIEVTHVNLNDETVEGIKHKNIPVFAVQFHPESGPGPHDGNIIFKEFANYLRKLKC